MSEQKEVKVYRAELYDEDYGAYTYHRVKVVLKSDYDALALENRKLKAASNWWKMRHENYIKNNFRASGETDEEIKEYLKHLEVLLKAEMEKCK